MLILNRREGEAITLTIGDIVASVTVLSSDRRGARLGIDAPLEVRVMRTELLDRDRAAR